MSNTPSTGTATNPRQRDVDRIVARYTNDPWNFLAFLSGWIGSAAFSKSGLSYETCEEIAEIIGTVMNQSDERYERMPP